MGDPVEARPAPELLAQLDLESGLNGGGVRGLLGLGAFQRFPLARLRVSGAYRGRKSVYLVVHGRSADDATTCQR
jgi:hypothetical protein